MTAHVGCTAKAGWLADFPARGGRSDGVEGTVEATCLVGLTVRRGIHLSAASSPRDADTMNLNLRDNSQRNVRASYHTWLKRRLAQCHSGMDFAGFPGSFLNHD